MSGMDQGTCALWYWGDYSLDYDTFDSEEDAARRAIDLEEEEHVVIGVQFADGRAVEKYGWAVYAEERRRFWERQEVEKTAPPRPTREIKDPFHGRTVKVDVSAPDWLGRRD